MQPIICLIEVFMASLLESQSHVGTGSQEQLYDIMLGVHSISWFSQIYTY